MTSQGPRVAYVTRAERLVFVTLDGRDYVFESQPATARKTRRIEHPEGEISMPMPGRVVRVHVSEGEAVKRGQALVVVEAMKMEHTLKAPRDGSVRHLSAKDGVLVEAGAMLMEIA